jgi:hypothetical protein
LDPDPAIFGTDLQDANKKLILLKMFFAYYFLKVHFHHFSKVKSPKEVTKQQESRFEGTFSSFFKGKKSKRSHKTVVPRRLFIPALQ